MVQVQIGTTSWESCPTGVPKSGYVLFDPANLVFNADKLTLDMVWDSGLNTLRARTQADRDAAATAATVNLRTTAAASINSDASTFYKAARGIVLVDVDTHNVTREWIMSFKAAVAASTSLANLQTRVAALPDLPDITGAQAKTAIQNKINSGGAD